MPNSVTPQLRNASPGSIWIVVPTYNERENLPPMVDAIRQSVPEATILVVDDNSPDGTGAVADGLARANRLVRVLHRSEKNGLGEAYRAGFRHALEDPRVQVIVQMDCDFSHDPRDLPRLIGALEEADLAIGSRYVPGGSTPGWDRRRRLISRSGSLFARTVLSLRFRDLTGGFKAWRAATLRQVMERTAYAQGYGFQVEMTWLAHRGGARVAELPIAFRDRVYGQSKMTGGIVREALVMVVKLRLRGGLLGRRSLAALGTGEALPLRTMEAPDKLRVP